MKINRKHIQNSFVHILGFLFHFIFFLFAFVLSTEHVFPFIQFCPAFWQIVGAFYTFTYNNLNIIHSIKMLLTKIRLFARTMFGLSVIWELCSARSQTFNRSNALQLLLFLLRKCIELEINSKVCVRACVCGCVQKLSVCLQVPVHPNGIIVCTAFTHCTKQMNERKISPRRSWVYGCVYDKRNKSLIWMFYSVW